MTILWNIVMCCALFISTFFFFCIYAVTNIGENNVDEKFYSDVLTNRMTERQPNIVVIIADDLGSRDVGYRGADDILTPNIDALAYQGVIFQRHYTLPTCTPSRAAFLTGRYPIRMGLQGEPLSAGEPRGIPLEYTLIPGHLKNLGYTTHLVGKWHVGYYTDNHVPTSRGFDTFYGYYNGYIQYFNHTIAVDDHVGYDFHSDEKDCLKAEFNYEYLTDLITEKAKTIISNHDRSRPFYLQIAHLAPHHSGIDAEPLQVRDEVEMNRTFHHIEDFDRRKLAGVMSAVDQSVGEIVKVLSETNMLENTVILFFSDNGGQTLGPIYPNLSTNYPLRGVKFTSYEGGIRNLACMYSPLIKNTSRISNDLIHLVDWLPTFYSMAGGRIQDLEDIDGINQWPSIVNGDKNLRNSFLVNIEEVSNMSSAVIGRYKLVKGNLTDLDGYYGEDYINPSSTLYNVSNVLFSHVGMAIRNSLNHRIITEKDILTLRNQNIIRCKYRNTINYPNCSLLPCIFDIFDDPCENKDLSTEYPEILDELESYIEKYRMILVKQTNTDVDPAALPENFQGVWMPWINTTTHECTYVSRTS